MAGSWGPWEGLPWQTKPGTSEEPGGTGAEAALSPALTRNLTPTFSRPWPSLDLFALPQ